MYTRNDVKIENYIEIQTASDAAWDNGDVLVTWNLRPRFHRSSLGFDRDDPNNIYNTADMAVQMIDDFNVRDGGLANDYGIIRGAVAPNLDQFPLGLINY